MSNPPGIAAASFEQLVSPLLARAAGLARAILHNHADAEDAVQDAALRAYRALASYDPARSFAGWWFAIVRNCCRDFLRHRQSNPPARPVDDADRQTPGHVPWQELCDALDSLSTQHRQILQLRYFAQCSYRDLADALDIPIGTVMSRLHAARQALASVYTQEKP
jgi:RNA polymerase sigma-70 factor (ECF subfamily)